MSNVRIPKQTLASVCMMLRDPVELCPLDIGAGDRLYGNFIVLIESYAVNYLDVFMPVKCSQCLFLCIYLLFIGGVLWFWLLKNAL